MECSCEIDVYDGDCEPVELFNKTTRTARKKHKCHECNREISKGEKYQHVSYLFEAKFWIDKTCNDCVSALEQFYPSGGYCSGMLWDDIRNHIVDLGGEVPESCISSVTAKARSKICDLVQETFL